jgi:hypothetical protein
VIPTEMRKPFDLLAEGFCMGESTSLVTLTSAVLEGVAMPDQATFANFIQRIPVGDELAPADQKFPDFRLSCPAVCRKMIEARSDGQGCRPSAHRKGRS